MKSPRPQIASIRQWWSPAELADACLPGFDLSERGIQRQIAAGAFAGYVRIRRGTRGKEIFWKALPAETQIAILNRYPGNADARDGDPAETDAGREARKRRDAAARFAAAAAFGDYLANYRGSKQAAAVEFCRAWKRRKVKIDAGLFTVLPAISANQIMRWHATCRGEDSALIKLIDKRGRDKKSRRFDRDPTLKNFIIAQRFANPHFDAVKICGLVERNLDIVVPKRTMQSWLAEFNRNNRAAVEAMTNPDAARSHSMPAVGSRSQGIVRLNQRWELDATPGDCICMVRNPGGTVELRRMKITALIDVTSRRAICVVSDQPSGIVTRALIRHGILIWGVPELIKSDNGKEFKNAAVMEFCRRMCIELDWSDPFSPEQKPHIERFFHTLNDDLIEMLPGYVGHNITDRKAIEARKSWAHRFGEDARIVFQVELSPEGLQARIEAWLRDVYEQRPHSGIGMAPAHRAEMLADQARFLDDPRVLDFLLMDTSIRIIGKRGIRIANRFYSAPALHGILGGGRKVRAMIDPLDPVWAAVYSADGNAFICIARDIDALPPDERASEAAQSKAVQRRAFAEIRQTARGILKVYEGGNSADAMLIAAAKANAPLIEASPEIRETMRIAARPQLVAIQQAADAKAAEDAGPQPVEPSAEAKAIYAEHVAELEARCAPPPARMEQCDGYERPAFVGDDDGFFDWCRSWIAAGNALDARDFEIFEQLKHDQTFMALRAMKNQHA